MAQTEYVKVHAVDCEKFFQAITRYEEYPKFVEGCKKVRAERSTDGKIKVHYDMKIIKDLQYTLEHSEDAAQTKMQWNLIESDLIKKNQGYWQLKSVGPGKTEIKYAIEIEFKIPVPGLILNGLIKGSLPAMIRAFEKRAKEL